MSQKVLIVFVITVIIFSESAFSIEKTSSEWSFSTLYGLHQPSLRALNSGLFQAPVSGNGTVTVETGAGAANETEEVDFRFDNHLQATPYGGKAAFELQWHPNNKYSLLFGFGSWERTTAAKQYIKIPSQLILSTADFERRAKLTYTEFTLGGNVVVLQKPKYAIYLRGSVHEVFDIDYREDLIFSYLSENDLQGNERVRTLEAQTAGLVMGQLAIGSEWYLQKWISVGVEAGYMKSERNAQLRGAVRKNDFISEDKIKFSGMPYAPLADGNLGQMSLDKDGNPITTTVKRIIIDKEGVKKEIEEEVITYKRMRLDFSGWQILFRMNIYY